MLETAGKLVIRVFDALTSWFQRHQRKPASQGEGRLGTGTPFAHTLKHPGEVLGSKSL